MIVLGLSKVRMNRAEGLKNIYASESMCVWTTTQQEYVLYTHYYKVRPLATGMGIFL